MGEPQLVLKVLILAIGYASTQDSGCDYSQKVKAGTTYYVYSPGYSDNYDPGVQCRWIAECPVGYNCVLDCTDIDIPYTTDCAGDRLLISKSGDSQLSGADHYCGKGKVKVVSTGQLLSVGLITSILSPGGKFFCQLTAQPASSQPCKCGYYKKARIVGGEETGINEYPMMAGIVLDLKSQRIECGGFIIDKRYVVTAAHCAVGRDPRDMAVVVGEHDITVGDSPATAAYKVASIIVHSNYNPSNNDNDIALLKTEIDMVFGPLVGPACLPFKFVNTDLTGKNVTVLGWGTQFFGGPTSDVLLKVNLEVQSQSACKRVVPDLTPRQICTYTPHKDACSKDSGGPLLYPDPITGLLFGVGVVSAGDLCDVEGQPGINTRITEFLSWIQSNTQDADYCRK